METIIKWMLKLRSLVLAIFFVFAAACVIMMSMVKINYDLVDYLPEGVASTVAIDVMEQSYEKAVPNLRVMIPNVTITEALDYKDKLEAVKGVDDINWLDDKVSLKIPLEMHDQKTVEDWYKDGAALYSIVISENGQRECLEEIRGIIGEEGAFSGNPVDTVNSQVSTSVEVKNMMAIIIPIMFLILLFTTSSWFEPVLFMVNVGVAILLNMGTNLIFGEISYITKTTGAILQLACSMDYAIFLLDRFAEIRTDQGLTPLEAMTQAISQSASSIMSSGLTTVVGFAALIAMRFKIGPDMGLVLAKGILISLIVTLVFMPCMVLYCYKIIDKTHHRSFMPSFKLLAKGTNKIKGIVTICVIVLLVPSALAKQNITFMFGTSGMAEPESKVVRDREAINGLFGQSSSFALMVPKGNLAMEQAINDEIKGLPEVSSVLSYVENVGNSVPEQYLPTDVLEMLNSEEYTRMVIMARIPPESKETFDFVAKLRGLADDYYGDTYHLVGESVNVYDIKDTIMADSVEVNAIAIGAIAVILMLTFRSLSLPILLLLTIESSIFINLAVPYFMDIQLNYIGYLIISSVQLGATVDYAILFTNRYIENRREMPLKEASMKTISDTAGSILTSGGILTAAGLVLGYMSTNSVISQLGVLIGRGAVLSSILVLVFLPALLTSMEPLIIRTTRKLDFYKPVEKIHGRLRLSHKKGKMTA